MIPGRSVVDRSRLRKRSGGAASDEMRDVLRGWLYAKRPARQEEDRAGRATHAHPRRESAPRVPCARLCRRWQARERAATIVRRASELCLVPARHVGWADIAPCDSRCSGVPAAAFGRARRGSADLADSPSRRAGQVRSTHIRGVCGTRCIGPAAARRRGEPHGRVSLERASNARPPRVARPQQTMCLGYPRIAMSIARQGITKLSAGAESFVVVRTARAAGWSTDSGKYSAHLLSRNVRLAHDDAGDDSCRQQHEDDQQHSLDIRRRRLCLGPCHGRYVRQQCAPQHAASRSAGESARPFKWRRCVSRVGRTGQRPAIRRAPLVRTRQAGQSDGTGSGPARAAHRRRSARLTIRPCAPGVARRIDCRFCRTARKHQHLHMTEPAKGAALALRVLLPALDG